MARTNTLTVTLQGDGWGRPGGAGRLYILHATIDGLYDIYKIGHTTQASIAPRIFAAQRVVDEKCTLLHTIATDHVRWAERWLHKQLRNEWTIREWFELTGTDLVWLRSIDRIEVTWSRLPHLAYGWL